MFDEVFRTRISRPMRPIARILLRAGVTANHITAGAFALSVAAAALLASGSPYTGLAVWLISRIGDALDGAVAREGHSSSPFGGFLDITLDMAAYSMMVLAFGVRYPALAPVWAAVLAGYVVVITSTLALAGAASSLDRRVSTTDRSFQFTNGIAEAGETSVMYALWIVLPSHVWWLAWLWVAALTATAIQRCYLAWRRLR